MNDSKSCKGVLNDHSSTDNEIHSKKQCKQDIRAHEYDESDSKIENGKKASQQNGHLFSRDGFKMVASVDMCYYCFDVLNSHLFNKPLSNDVTFINDRFPIFVTWKIGKEKRLRGCIGTFNSNPLHSTLKEFTLSSALRDSRFSPITKEEFDQLHVSVSLLVDFELCKDYIDWEVGIHGIRIDLHGKYNATFLPEVASERKWDHETTIDTLLRKGGYRGSITDQVRRDVRVTRYRSEKVSVSYQQYLDWKNEN
ncbi:hypothetical protein RDWZM_005469 [Blomia tropicalis]|uniref:AMMECR1 domain-containing protein n=1 Tax=Blomia tropicalis TaxID=40697 RepID=A0A9Q0M7U9_BLOTA|nr:hypothetical protein RDWZM_005469 [Blomia tropicalis]